MYLADVGLPRSGDLGFAGAKLFAIGDLNNDRQNDIVTVSEDQTRFAVHYFQQEGGYRFTSAANETQQSVQVPPGFKIT